MPVFGAIGLLRRIKTQRRNPLNRCCLINGRLFFPVFPQQHPQVLKARRNYQEYVEEPVSILTTGNRSRIVCYHLTNAMSDLVAYIDGGSLGNPGPSGIGVVMDGPTDGTIRIAKWIGHQDNNVAEYLCSAGGAAMCPGA